MRYQKCIAFVLVLKATTKMIYIQLNIFISKKEKKKGKNNNNKKNQKNIYFEEYKESKCSLCGTGTEDRQLYSLKCPFVN